MSLHLLSLLFLGSTADASDELLPAPQPMVFLQSWVTLLDQDQYAVADPGGYGDPEDDPGFKLRRARVGFEGKNDQVKYGITAGMSAPYDVVEAAQGHDGSLGLVDAYGGFSPAEKVWIVGGLQKVPVSREALMASSNLALSDRAISTAWLTPGRDLGGVVDARLDMFRFRVGAFNGGGDLLGDDNPGKLFAARIEANLGEAPTYRTHGTVDDFTVGVGMDGWTDAGRSVASSGVGADVIVRFAGLALLVEGRRNQLEPKDDLVVVPGTLAETVRQGVLAQLGYTVGAFEPAIRYSILDDDTNAEDAGDAAELLGGVTWHSDEDQIRAGLGYASRLENGGNVVPNNTLRAWFQLKL